MLVSGVLQSDLVIYTHIWGFPLDSDGRESACNAGNLSSIPRLGRSPGEGNGYPLHYSYLENSMDRGARQATYSSWGCKQTDTTEQHSLFIHISILFQILLHIVLNRGWSRVPCAIEQVLVGYLFYIQWCVCVSSRLLNMCLKCSFEQRLEESLLLS